MKHTAVAVSLCLSATLFAQSWSIQDDRTIELIAGEGQSTVVAPGSHPDCPAGRILASTEDMPGQTGTVAYRDLDKNETKISTFGPPDADHYGWGTSDHDLVSLSNGEVLYLTGAFSRAPLQSQPAWWDSAYRWNFGPGARSVLLAWRSKNCGKTFEFAPELTFDPARIGDGSCAMPQGTVIHRHTEAGSAKYLAPFSGFSQSGDDRFRWCWKCEQLFLADPNQPTVCPRGNGHESGGGAYKVTTASVAGQTSEAPFRSCKACGTLHRLNASSACVAQQTHDSTGSLTYFLIQGDTPASTPDKIQDGWRWCHKCEGLFRGTTDTACPTGGRHDLTASGKYQIALTSFELPGHQRWAHCGKCKGLFHTMLQPSRCPNAARM